METAISRNSEVCLREIFHPPVIPVSSLFESPQQSGGRQQTHRVLVMNFRCQNVGYLHGACDGSSTSNSNSIEFFSPWLKPMRAFDLTSLFFFFFFAEEFWETIWYAAVFSLGNCCSSVIAHVPLCPQVTPSFIHEE